MADRLNSSLQKLILMIILIKIITPLRIAPIRARVRGFWNAPIKERIKDGIRRSQQIIGAQQRTSPVIARTNPVIPKTFLLFTGTETA